jgi:hypothetical protein
MRINIYLASRHSQKSKYMTSYFNKKLDAETKDICVKITCKKIDERMAAYFHISK